MAKQKMRQPSAKPPPTAVGPPGVLSKSIFGCPNLLSKKDNLFDFARDHVAQRLQAELRAAADGVGVGGQTAVVISKKVRPNPLRGKQAPKHTLTVGEGGGQLRVGDSIPSENARQVLIATSWRSGSSFFGDLLQHYPGSYYSFEPLHFNMSSVEDEKEVRTFFQQ